MAMPRLNIYLPNDVYELANEWRGSANLSEICARAIRDELDAAATHRAALTSLESSRAPTSLESALIEKYSLASALVAETPLNAFDLRDRLGKAAATFIDQNICDGSMLAMAGGRQTWCVVRNLSPRRVRCNVTALGVQQVDPRLLHVHPNTLTTLLWLLYGPRSEAHLISGDFSKNPWLGDLPERDHVVYFVVASCSQFSSGSPFASLVGEQAAAELTSRQVAGDFAYVFFDSKGHALPVSLPVAHSIIPEDVLRRLSKRQDARVLLVAGGSDKLLSIEATLSLGLCNMLVTDTNTAQLLLEPTGGAVQWHARH